MTGNASWRAAALLLATMAVAPALVAQIPEPSATEAASEDVQESATASPKSEARMSEREVAELRKAFAAATLSGRRELRAYYKDLGIDIEATLGIGAEQKAEADLVDNVVGVLDGAKFDRSPQDVLEQRVGLAGNRSFPNPSQATGREIGDWLRAQVVAGEWERISQLLRDTLSPESGQAIATKLLEKLAEGDAQLLPEEVLDVAEIVPGELTTVNITALARMLKTAAARHGTATLMQRVQAGTPKFSLDAVGRRRAVQLLEAADLSGEAQDALPPLAQARADGDVIVVMAHAKAMQSAAERMTDGPDADKLRRSAFSLFAESGQLPSASPEQVKESMRLATRLMPRVPRTLVQPWLDTVFASEALTRIEAEVLALEAANLGSRETPVSESTNMMVSLAHAVEAMLAAPNRGQADLGIPLRMLTNAVSEQLEAALEDRDNKDDPYARVPFALLIQAAPSPAWLDAVEPSVATRATRAAIAVAVADDNMDAAVDRLRDAARRSKADAPELAEKLLDDWAQELRRPHYRYYWETATRGQQQRRLAALRDLIGILRGLDVDAKQLTATVGVFEACHQADEVYKRDEIEAIFGPIEQLPPLTACELVDTMCRTIRQYWDARIQPPATGKTPKTPTAELSRVVNNGYDTALAIVEAARANAPGFWRVDAVGASVAYDRLQMNRRLGKLEPGRELEVLGTAFASFERAAQSYADALKRNEQVESSDIYSRWFRAALGASDTALLRVEELPAEGSVGDSQFAHIRAAIQQLPEDVAYRHTAAFAQEIVDVLDQAPSAVKPRLVHSALEVIADHPSGAPLRKLDQLYVDLAKNDVRLRLTIDGSPHVEAGKPFAVLLSLRYTQAVERSASGFEACLQNESGGEHRRDNFERDIRQTLAKGFDVQGLSWFEASLPGEGVIEDGQEGWLQKPLVMAYVVPRDVSVDQLPQIKLQLDFYEQGGDVTVVLPSNTPSIVVSNERSPRPCPELTVTQTIDTRKLDDPKSTEIELEVVARGNGTLPELRDLLAGCDGAAPGFALGSDAIATQPLLFEDPQRTSPSTASAQAATMDAKPADETLNIVRPVGERSWLLHYRPDGTASTGRFSFPALSSGVAAKLVNRAYGETDLVPVPDGVLVFGPTSPWPRRLVWGGAVALGLGALVVGLMRLRRARVQPVVERFTPPRRHTPLAVIMTLRRWQQECTPPLDEATQSALSEEIRKLEADVFGPAPRAGVGDNLQQVLSRWESRLEGWSG